MVGGLLNNINWMNGRSIMRNLLLSLVFEEVKRMEYILIQSLRSMCTREGQDLRHLEIEICWDDKTIVDAITLFTKIAYVVAYNDHDLKDIPKEFGELKLNYNKTQN
jgi:hypothetical protein